MSIDYTALADFLDARLSEDKVTALAARSDEPSGAWGEYGEFTSRPNNVAVALALRFSPDRVLADIAAKRAIVSAWRNSQANADWDLDNATAAALSAFEWVLRQLATVYADHDDYREEWAP